MGKVLSTLVAVALALGGLAACSGESGWFNTGGRGMSSSSGSSGSVALSPDDVRNRLQSAGYSSVSNLQREGNRYTGTAMRGGQRYSVSVHATTGEIQSAAPY